MIKILNTSFNRLGVIKNAITSTRLEEINGENILDFQAVLDHKLNNLINENTVFELDNDWFDTAFLKKVMNEDNTYTVEVEAEHVSYRLNNSDYDKEYFTELGNPTYILGKILQGTGFTVGIVEYTNVETYSAQEAKSRRQLLMEFVAYLRGEVRFRKFTIDILNRRGSSDAKPVIKDRNVRVVSKTINKREFDEEGNPLVSYECAPIYLPGDNYDLGDNVRLMQKDLGINEELRVISISRNPYDIMNVTFQFANYTNGLESNIYRIATSMVEKGKLYHGIRISAENGFECIRSDKKARSKFNSDTFVMQSSTDEGETWRDRIYFDPINGNYIFDGLLSATAIQAISAEIDIVISNTVITNNLYAERGHIAELTVDRLDTSNKLARFNGEDTSQMFFMRLYEQRMEFIEASTDGTEVQLVDRHERALYWKDEEKQQVSHEVTDFPIMVYAYTESKKLQMFFTLDPESGFQIPMMVWGAGVLGPDDENGKGFLFKDATGFVFRYVKANGVPCEVRLGEDGMELSCGSDMEYCEYAEFDWAGSVEMMLVNAYSQSCIVTAGVIGSPSDFSSASFSLIVERIKETVGGQECFSRIKVTPAGSAVPNPSGAKITINAICRGIVRRDV